MKRTISMILSAVTALSLITAAKAAAPVEYMPGVTKEMSAADFWTEDCSGEILAAPEEIAEINAAALVTSGSNMHDLANRPDSFNGETRNESLKKGAAEDAAYYLGWTYGETGEKYTQADFDEFIANCGDPTATENMSVRWGIAANRTVLYTFPCDKPIYDDPKDLDFDYNPLVGIRVNEPVLVFTTSADRKYYQVFTSCCSGWAPVEDIALCRDKEEWLSAWQIP
ncbi:MAG: SH3 domain-containing protein, partial [Oscillospiraceae bacterium]|nr:SH3 domain-containing protein [Oscillospiraceae bacterium]